MLYQESGSTGGIIVVNSISLHQYGLHELIVPERTVADKQQLKWLIKPRSFNFRGPS